ncbi:hypothetical protein LLG90_02725 [Aromatoleum toluclasticum]|nr:hypothetical protein [Aromatoleum toluclasticum]
MDVGWSQNPKVDLLRKGFGEALNEQPADGLFVQWIRGRKQEYAQLVWYGLQVGAGIVGLCGGHAGS